MFAVQHALLLTQGDTYRNVFFVWLVHSIAALSHASIHIHPFSYHQQCAYIFFVRAPQQHYARSNANATHTQHILHIQKVFLAHTFVVCVAKPQRFPPNASSSSIFPPSATLRPAAAGARARTQHTSHTHTHVHFCRAFFSLAAQPTMPKAGLSCHYSYKSRHTHAPHLCPFFLKLPSAPARLVGFLFLF